MNESKSGIKGQLEGLRENQLNGVVKNAKKIRVRMDFVIASVREILEEKASKRDRCQEKKFIYSLNSI